MGLFGVLPFFLLSCITFLLILIRRKHIKTSNLPPGPTPLPLLGNLLQVNFWNTISSFHRLKEIYGPVFTIYRGSRPVVVLCGYEAMKEAFIDNAEAFGDKAPYLPVVDILGNYGVVSSNGERWRQLRRFSLSTLRNFGMGKRSIEERIQEEAQFLVEALQKTQGHPFDPTVYISHAVSNIICSVVFGNRFEYEDKNFITLLNLTSTFMQCLSSPWAQAKIFFPGLMRILPGSNHKLTRCCNDLKSFITQRVQIHRESYDPNCLRDFIDCFLAKMEQEKDNPASEFHDKTLTATILNLFIAGTETVSTTIRYGLLILLRYPEIKAKIQEEIDHVIGSNRSPCIEDRSQMPYTDAVIHEIQRFGDISVVMPVRTVTSNTEIQGYSIPKGTTVMASLSSVLHDSQHFEMPEKFNPGHFLDENGAFKKNEAFLPFSAGKRICLGEGLARMELFLFFTTVFQNLNVKALQDRNEIDISPVVQGSGKRPRPYRLCVVPR